MAFGIPVIAIARQYCRNHVEEERQPTLKGNNNSSRAISKRLVVLIIVIMAIAPALTIMVTQKQSQETSNPNKASREDSPSTITYWAETNGGNGSDWAYSVQQTADGGYIVAGYTESFGAGSGDVWVLKLSSSGSVTWEKTYGGTSLDDARSVQQTADGGYVVAGKTQSFGAGSGDFWVLKLNSTGGVTWQKTYGGSGDDGALSVQQTADLGYIVAGVTYSFGAVGGDAWVLKLNSTGGVTWQKTYGGSSIDYAYSVQQTADSGYIVAGYTSSSGAGNMDVWVLKLNSTGGVTWQKTYGGNSMDDAAQSVQQTSDGGYIVAGYTESFGAVGGDAWVLKLNSTGGVTWQKTYGGNSMDEALSVKQTSDGGYIVAGYTGSFGAGNFDVWVLELNSTGGVTWQKTYGGTGNDYGWSVQQTSNGGYIVAGSTYSFGAGISDVWVLKLGVGGYIVWDAGSGASTQTTSVTPSDSNSATSTISMTAASSAAAVGNTGVTPQNSVATLMIQSHDTTPPAAIADLVTGTATNSSITLTWTAPGDEGMNGNATGYAVKYSTIGHITAVNWTLATTFTQTWIPAKNGTSETHVVTGLNPGITYWFAVEAYDGASNYGGVSNSPSGTTIAIGGQGIPLIILVGGVAVVAIVAVISIVIIKKRKT